MTITEPQPRRAAPDREATPHGAMPLGAAATGRLPAHSPQQGPADHGRTEVLRSVANAIDVLECFAVDPELGVSDIARKLGA